MIRSIIAGDKVLRYTHKRVPRSRRVRLLVNCDATVVVTTPMSYPVYLMESFIRQKIDWVWDKINFWRAHPPTHPILSARDRRKEFLAYYKQAKVLVAEMVARVNMIYNYTYKKISIRDQKTRWGSCARSGHLSFNYRLAKLPAHLAEYVVAHELCHLREMNHSARFWRLVERAIPDYLHRRRELRKMHY